MPCGRARQRPWPARPASVDADPWRQTFHIQPPVGLLNDPNGLVEHEGTYHLCYQWHPFEPAHGLKFWAHLTSTDLVHWVEQVPALTPSSACDMHGCYSGSGIVHEGAVRFLYTGNVFSPDGRRLPHQNLATLEPDGRVVKHPANPVVPPLDGYTGDIRDPKVWAQDGAYWMVLGAQTLDGVGTVLLLRSADLVSWAVLGEVAGGAADPRGYMWECPDLLHLDGRDVLVVSPLSDRGEGAEGARFVDETVYSVGSLDLTTARFTGAGFRARGRRAGLLRTADVRGLLGADDHGRLDGDARPLRPAGARGQASDSGQRVGALPDRAAGGEPGR